VRPNTLPYMTDEEKASAKQLTVTIDGRQTTVPEGTTVLDAARAMGIRIPTLCNDPRLEAYGGCRLCLVEIQGGRCPVPSCATKVSDGMVVTATSEHLTHLRKTVCELLLSDHPADCMVCEQAGECELQDIAYELGANREKFAGERHKYALVDDNPFFVRDYNKCVDCGRCIRICDEVQNRWVYDFVDRGFDAVPSTGLGMPITDTICELCGQCVSTCPTGALSPKLKAKQGRAWQTKATNTVCPYCGVGCNLTLHTRDGAIVDVTSPADRGPNYGNLCVKGRFGWAYVGSGERLTTPLIKRDGKFEEASWEQATDYVASRLLATKAERGPDAIAGLSSAKCTNEENYAFQKLFRQVIGTNNVDHCARL